MLEDLIRFLVEQNQEIGRENKQKNALRLVTIAE